MLNFQATLSSDTALFARLHAECFPKSWDVKEFATLLESGVGIIGFCQETPVGFSLCSVVKDEAEILTFGVIQAERGKAYGAALLTHTLKTLKAHTINTIFLEVAATNAAALALYQSAGFVQTGIRRNYYATPEGAVNAIMMELKL